MNRFFPLFFLLISTLMFIQMHPANAGITREDALNSAAHNAAVKAAKDGRSTQAQGAAAATAQTAAQNAYNSGYGWGVIAAVGAAAGAAAATSSATGLMNCSFTLCMYGLLQAPPLVPKGGPACAPYIGLYFSIQIYDPIFDPALTAMVRDVVLTATCPTQPVYNSAITATVGPLPVL